MAKKIPMKNSILFALVDDEVYDSLSCFEWELVDNYVIRREGRSIIRMHRVIMECNDTNLIVDHKDGNTLNNKRSNLRICTKSQNMMNAKGRKRPNSSSLYKGVRLLKTHGYYQSRIQVNKKTITIGHFSDEIAAANAYNHYATKHHKEFAKLNDVPFMDEETFMSYEIPKKEKRRVHYVSI